MSDPLSLEQTPPSGAAKQAPPSDATAGPAETRKSVSAWNSLEVTKLIVTIIIATIGGFYTVITYQ